MEIVTHWATTLSRSKLKVGKHAYYDKTSRAFFWKDSYSWMCLAALSFLFCLAVCLFHSGLPDPVTHLLPSTVDNSGVVTLLLWTHPFGRYHKLPDCKTLYQIPSCMLTDDWHLYPQADAVIIHHREIASNESRLPPDPRPHTQKWIWMNFESPTHTHNLQRFEGVFNLTMTYRTDSDIFLPYGYLLPLSHRQDGSPRNALSPHSLPLHRPHLLAWVISNWSESQARVAFYHKLSRYVRVDIFGHAGVPLPANSGSKSVVRLMRGYQFYLALENSQHTDYITEKVWNALLAGAIPVVLGPSRENYERFLPPEAFIHVEDFPTVRKLAQYLVQLRRIPTHLQRHLDWRRNYSLHQPKFWAEHYCTACRVVRNTKHRADVVTDLTGWFKYGPIS